MPKKILLLGVLFVGMIALSIFLLSKRMPPMDGPGPVLPAEKNTIGKIIIDEPSRSITLEKKEQDWWITAPLEDVANLEIIDQLVGTLNSFTLGTVISEKKDKYPTFDLDPSKATRIQLFKQGGDQALLEGYVGKQAISYGTSYFRYANQDPVYIATNLPNWVLLRAVEEYRVKKLIPFKQEAVTSFEINGEKASASFTRSSDTWTRATSTGPVDVNIVKSFLGKLEQLQAAQFEDNLDPAQKLGFEKPILTILVETSSGPVSGKVGVLKKYKKGEPDLRQRFAQTEGRKTVLLVNSSAVDEVLTLLKTTAK